VVQVSIVAVSDVHLGMEGANEGNFIEFLEHLDFGEVKHLVLLGDIIDLWRRDFTNAFMENAAVLKLISEIASKTKVHYVIGNHDYYLLRLSEINGQNFPFEVSKTLTLKNEAEQPAENRLDYFFIHGYQLEVLCNPYYKSMKTYEAFSEQLCLAGDEKGNAAEQAWKLIQSSASFFECLKRIPEDPRGALRSMMEPPEERIQNYDKTSSSIP
jgi:UDP-2,3-diacylglucosamine pyrophosphatase LpxH